MSKNLTFKLILDGDSRGLVSAIEQSEKTSQALFNTIKAKVREVREESVKANAALSGIAASEVKQSVSQLVREFTLATSALDSMGDDAEISAESIKQIGVYGQESIQKLEASLKSAKLELNYLTATSATPGDIEGAQKKVRELEQGIKQTSIAFNAYKSAAELAITETEKIDDSKSIPELKKQLESAKAEVLRLSLATGGVSFEKFNAASKQAHDLEFELSRLGDETTETTNQVKQLDDSLDRAQSELQQTESASKAVSGELQGLKTGLNVVTSALAALGIGATAQEIAQTADEYKNLSGRISIAIGEHGNLQKAMDDVKQIAIATNSNLTATGDLFSRLTKIGQESKWTQEQVLGLTETINKAIQVGGGSAASNEAAITQLNQALGSGVLRGDEFNSMMEQSPRLTQALAEGLGITTGKLREMAGEGKLTTEVVTKALLSQSEKISAEFAKFPATIGASIENLKTAWTVYIGEADAASGVSEKVANSLKFVAENLDAIVSTLTLAGQAFIAYKALNIGLVFLDKAKGVQAASLAITQETTAVVANTQAQIANANATKATTTAKGQLASATASTGSSLMGLVGRLGTLGIAITALGVMGGAVVGVLTPLGEWMGEATAKAMGYGEAIEELEKQQKREAIQAKVTAEIKAEQAAAAEKAREKTYQLTEGSKSLVAQYDELITKGEPTKEALDKISNAMVFDSSKGINDAITALILLKDQGKITGDDLQISLSKGLDGKDLIVFETNARAAFAGTAKEAEKSAQVTEAVMKAALDRTGFSTEQLQGKFSLAFQSASNDVQLILNNLDAYKAKGIDTGLALSANLNKAIDTSETRAELDYAKAKLKELEIQGLITGEQAALGLSKIENKAQQLPDALNPALAAFAALGIKTKDQLNEAAESAQRNFEVVSKSGQATADAIKHAYTQMLNAALETGDKAKVASIQAKAASLGLQVQVDQTGKATVTSMDEVSSSVDRVGRSFDGLKDHARSAGEVMREEALSSTEAWAAALEKTKGTMHQARSGQRSTLAYNVDAIAEKLKADGYDDKQAQRIAEELWENSRTADGKAYKQLGNSWSFAGGGGGMSNVDYVNEQLERYLGNAPVSSSSITAPSIPNTPTISEPKNVNYSIQFGGKTLELSGSSDQENVMNQLINQLKTQAKSS